MWKKITRKAAVTQAGAILLGKYVACDEFEWERPVGVITHAHANHISGLERSLGYCHHILVSKATRDLLIAIKGDWLRFRINLQPLPYRRVFQYKDERIMLYPAEHMLGSAQVLVENADGIRLVYTGDFLLPGTPPLDSDILILDTTYGDPINIMKYSREQAIDRLVLLINNLMKKEVPIHVLASTGNLQEVMSILYNHGLNVPFIVSSDKILRVCKVYQKHGMKLGEPILDKSDEGQELLRRKQPCIVFHSIRAQVKARPKVKISSYISDWERTDPLIRLEQDYWVVTLPSHADFNGILYYVEEARPKFVITDNKRSYGKAMLAAQQIKLKLGIEAIALPMP